MSERELPPKDELIRSLAEQLARLLAEPEQGLASWHLAVSDVGTRLRDALLRVLPLDGAAPYAGGT